MAQIDIRREYADGTILLESDLDAIVDDVETFLNTTKINDDNIQNNSITASDKIADATITAAKLGTSAVTTAKINDLAVTTAKINDLAVTTAKIAATAVTEAKIDTGAVTEAKIGSAAVTEAKIGSGAVTAAKIGTSAVGATKILMSDWNTTQTTVASVTATYAAPTASSATYTLNNASRYEVIIMADSVTSTSGLYHRLRINGVDVKDWPATSSTTNLYLHWVVSAAGGTSIPIIFYGIVSGPGNTLEYTNLRIIVRDCL